MVRSPQAGVAGAGQAKKSRNRGGGVGRRRSREKSGKSDRARVGGGRLGRAPAARAMRHGVRGSAGAARESSPAPWGPPRAFCEA